MHTLGRRFRVTLVGESHNELAGVHVDGVPPGIPFGEDDVQPALNRRRPGQSLLTSQRREPDEVHIRAGTYDGRTTGSPLLMYIENEDTDSTKYHRMKHTPRPGHSDYPARVRYKGWNDYRGGGMFSARLTAGLVMAGALAGKICREEGIEVAAHVKSIGPVEVDEDLGVEEIRANVEDNPVRCAVPGKAEEMEEVVHQARSEKDSRGGVVDCVAEGMPVGLGEPIVDDVESVVSHAVFVIPAAKGVEFGDGFDLSKMKGSESNDEFRYDEDGNVVTETNSMGGILGGLTTGMPLRFRVAFKPTSSIAQEQETVHLKDEENTTLEIRGRHDPCIVPRAVPIVEAVTKIVLADLILQRDPETGTPEEANVP